MAAVNKDFSCGESPTTCIFHLITKFFDFLAKICIMGIAESGRVGLGWVAGTGWVGVGLTIHRDGKEMFFLDKISIMCKIHPYTIHTDGETEKIWLILRKSQSI